MKEDSDNCPECNTSFNGYIQLENKQYEAVCVKCGKVFIKTNRFWVYSKEWELPTFRQMEELLKG
jgi:hypothetical protein